MHDRAARGASSTTVPNERGYDAALRSTAANVTSARRAFNRANGNASLEEAIARVERSSWLRMFPTVTISVCFGCPFEGPVDLGRVASLAARFTGAGGRARGHDRGRDALARPGARRAHEAQGFTGTTRATRAGGTAPPRSKRARVLDASVGASGLPVRPRATGNVATEDLVYLLEGEGIETASTSTLIGVSAWLEALGRAARGLRPIAPVPGRRPSFPTHAT